MIMGLPMMSLTFCNFLIKTGLILSAPQEQGHWTSSFEKFLLKSPINKKSRKTPEGINRLFI
jgi:hypothetical protein